MTPDTPTPRRHLEALYRADEYLHRHLRLDQVLRALVDVVIDILHADKASVQVWDEHTQRLTVRAARNYSDAMLQIMSGYKPGDGIAGNVFIRGEPIAIEDARLAPPPANEIAKVEGIRSVLSVPLTISGRVFGVFAMDYCQPRTFSGDDRRLFLALARRAAMAIENARLYEQAAQAAILEERQRLARELHDSVTQSLYSLVLLSEAGNRFAAAGDLQHLSQVLARLGETSQQALREMRLMVYELRPIALRETGLVSALQQRLDVVEKRAGIHVELRVDGDISLPARVEDELYRIAQEALNNALKHAAAAAIYVTLRGGPGALQLQIRDDGRGVNLVDGQTRGGIGFSSMRERAARIGAQLQVDAAPQSGVTVTVTVPLSKSEFNSHPLSSGGFYNE